MSDLDLETGDLSRAEKIQAEGSAARSSRRQSRAAGSKSRTGKTTAAKEAEDSGLKSKLQEMFQDFAEQFQERDPELADVLNRRKDAMSQGLVGLTRNIKLLRGPLVLLVNFFQPTLAFWELGGLLIHRYISHQQRRAIERREQQNGLTDVTDVTGNNQTDNENHGYATAN
ncbi:MAG: hypothetical protein KGL39_32140 [Patescibacteria group bacterium]|nr:hypothetical protein [Patescibacteria group bacterium]